MGDGRIFLKASATLPLIKIYRMSLFSAGSISLDSTFKEYIYSTCYTKRIKTRREVGKVLV
jgi:hypothetical protein